MKKISLQRVETRRATSLRRNALSMAAAVMMLFATGAGAQVTIGSGDVPQKYSVLELISHNKLGVRLPQIETTDLRDDILTDAEKTNPLSMGLQIFNMETRCVETWNGSVWIQSCSGDGPVIPPPPPSSPSKTPQNCTITPSSGSHTVYTAKADPNAAAYEFFVGGVSQGTQSSNVLTLPSATAFSQVTVQYLYPADFLKPKMIAVQGGTFQYQLAHPYPSSPGSSVTLSDFFMGDVPVTQAQFEAVMGVNPSYFQCGGTGAQYVTTRPTSALAVEQVSWYDAITYCNKLSLLEGKTPVYSIIANGVEINWANLPYSSIPTSQSPLWDAVTQNLSANGYRLPTEAEWEYAARGGQQSEMLAYGNARDFHFSGSDNVDEVAWYKGNNNTGGNPYGTKPVKDKPANVLGLYGMSGNVNEYCWDWDGIIVSGTDPVGPASGTYRVTCGGSWYHDAAYARVLFHGLSAPPYNRLPPYMGFRVVCR